MFQITLALDIYYMVTGVCTPIHSLAVGSQIIHFIMIWVQDGCPETLSVQNREQKETGCLLPLPPTLPLQSGNASLKYPDPRSRINKTYIMWSQATVLTASSQNEESRVADLLVWLLRALPALLRTLFLSQSQHCCWAFRSSNRRARPFNVRQDPLAVERPVGALNTVAAHELQARASSWGASPEAGSERSVSSLPHCYLLGFGGPWSPAYTVEQHNPSGSHSPHASAQPGYR